MKNRLITVAALGLVAAAILPPAVAHHSFASFSMDKDVTLKGTVRTFEWSNPHVWLWLYVSDVDGKPVTDKDGNAVLWGLEGAAPGELLRQGIRNKSLQPGDHITVTTHPLKDGRNGGSLGRITFPDGKTLGGATPTPPGGPPPGAAAAPAAAPR